MAAYSEAVADTLVNWDSALTRLASGDVQRSIVALGGMRADLTATLRSATDPAERRDAALGLVVSDLVTVRDQATLGRHLDAVTEDASVHEAGHVVATLWRTAAAQTAAGQPRRAVRASDVSLALINAASPGVRESVVSAAVAEYSGPVVEASQQRTAPEATRRGPQRTL